MAHIVAKAFRLEQTSAVFLGGDDELRMRHGGEGGVDEVDV